MTDKIQKHHLERTAVLYIRQSSSHQLQHNEESRRLQYEMRARLISLGWTSVDVIDEDLGCSAGGTVERSGFQRLVTDVSLGYVGAVAAREVSRFARNSRDWQQLVELCRIVDTLLVDQDAIYDARRSNDRLLLGLKGTMNEYELELLRFRSDEAKRAKAQRGELVHQAPAGYQWSPEGVLEKTPDIRVQNAIKLIFEKCQELGSCRQTMFWFAENGLEVPVSRPGRQQEVIWKKGTQSLFLRVLRNPAYAGFYGWGKTATSTEVQEGQVRSVRRRRPPNEWSVLIPEHHEAYVSKEVFDEVQKMLDQNAQSIPSARGAAKTGRALLTGLLRCRRCGHRLQVNYGGRNHPNVYRYVCVRARIDRGEPACVGFSGVDVDKHVGDEVLKAVRPGAIEASIAGQQDDRGQQEDLLEALRLDLEAARYAALRAQKQFDEVDPDNRLVAGELERRWNDALERVQRLVERVTQEEGAIGRLKHQDQETLGTLALDVEEVWNAPESDVRIKKRIARTVIEEILVDLDEASNSISLIIHWKGGIHTALTVPRRRCGERNGTCPDVLNAIRQLSMVMNDVSVARVLGRAGLRTRRGLAWTGHRVASIRCSQNIAVFSEERKRALGCMTLLEAAQASAVSTRTLKRAIVRGELEAVQPVKNGPWILFKANVSSFTASASKQTATDGVVDSKAAQLTLGNSDT